MLIDSSICGVPRVQVGMVFEDCIWNYLISWRRGFDSSLYLWITFMLPMEGGSDVEASF